MLRFDLTVARTLHDLFGAQTQGVYSSAGGTWFAKVWRQAVKMAENPPPPKHHSIPRLESLLASI